MVDDQVEAARPGIGGSRTQPQRLRRSPKTARTMAPSAASRRASVASTASTVVSIPPSAKNGRR